MSKPDDRAMAMVTSALLKRGRMVHHFTIIFIVFALILISTRHATDSWPLGISLLFGVAEFWFALRVGLDADLFDGLASERADAAGMDKALVKLGLVGQAKTGRSMEDRTNGAIRLLRLQVLCLVGQIVAFIICVFLR